MGSNREGRQRGFTPEATRYSSDGLHEVCGRSPQSFVRSLRPSFRILNGTCAQYGDFPWVAEIQMKSHNTGKYKQHCGGTIVSEDLIVTAAHCVQ